VTSSIQIKKFVFDAMLIEDSLFELQKSGIPVKEGIEQAPITRVSESSFSPIIWKQAIDMSSVYVVLFCVENALRDFIVARLSESKGLSWWDDCVQSKVKDEAKKLRQKEEKNKYMSSRGDSLIYYTLLDNLAQIIIHNWDDFSDIIPNQAWITSRMHDLTMCRNIIMHTGVLPQYEIERIESIARDFINQLG